MKDLKPAMYQMLGTVLNGDLGPYTFYWSQRGHRVMFLKTWPKDPATYNQNLNRNRWRHAAARWKALDQQTRDDWITMGRNANLTISGYNLFIFYITDHGTKAVETIQRLTKMDVLTATGPPIPWPEI